MLLYSTNTREKKERKNLVPGFSTAPSPCDLTCAHRSALASSFSGGRSNGGGEFGNRRTISVTGQKKSALPRVVKCVPCRESVHDPPLVLTLTIILDFDWINGLAHKRQHGDGVTKARSPARSNLPTRSSVLADATIIELLKSVSSSTLVQATVGQVSMVQGVLSLLRFRLSIISNALYEKS